jgi:hypothetical protein
MDKFTKHITDDIATVKKDPSQLTKILADAATAHDSGWLSNDQYSAITTYVTQFANNTVAERAAQHAVDLTNKYFGIPQVPGANVGGSYAPPNPRYQGP